MRLKSSARGSGPGLASPNPTDIAIGAGRGKAAAAGSPVAAASCSRLRSLAAKQAKDIGLDAVGRTLPVAAVPCPGMLLPKSKSYGERHPSRRAQTRPCQVAASLSTDTATAKFETRAQA